MLIEHNVTDIEFEYIGVWLIKKIFKWIKRKINENI